MNNITLLNLNLKRITDQNPLFSFSYERYSQIHISKFNIHYSSSPFLHLSNSFDHKISKKSVIIDNSNFQHFISKVIHTNTLNNDDRSSISFLSRHSKFSRHFKSSGENVIMLSCCFFKDVHTHENGSIFDITGRDINDKVIITNCRFFNISTTQYPSCFYVDSLTFSINKTIFSDCQAMKGTNYNDTNCNAKYGNAFFTFNSYNDINYVSTYHCSPVPEEAGDSAIETKKAFSLDYHYSNSTKNYGKNGASSISFWNSQADINHISYINNYDSSEHNSLETRQTQQSYIQFANFINTSRNTVMVFNNAESNTTFDMCAFIDSHSRVFGETEGTASVTVINCISDTNNLIGTNYTTVNKDARINFSFTINPECVFTLSHNENHSLWLQLHSYSLFFASLLIPSH